MDINNLHMAVSSGDKSAEKKLFETLSENFLLFVQHRIWDKQDAREIVQDTLTTVASKYRGIDFEVSFAAWAYRVLQNNLLNYYRTRKYQEARFVAEPEQESASPEHSVSMELKRKLLDCLKKVSALNLKHARILNLSYQGYNVPEICDRLNLSSGNCYKLLSRARTGLRECLGMGDEQE